MDMSLNRYLYYLKCDLLCCLLYIAPGIMPIACCLLPNAYCLVGGMTPPSVFLYKYHAELSQIQRKTQYVCHGRQIMNLIILPNHMKYAEAQQAKQAKQAQQEQQAKQTKLAEQAQQSKQAQHTKEASKQCKQASEQASKQAGATTIESSQHRAIKFNGAGDMGRNPSYLQI